MEMLNIHEETLDTKRMESLAHPTQLPNSAEPGFRQQVTAELGAVVAVVLVAVAGVAAAVVVAVSGDFEVEVSLNWARNQD